MQFFAGGVVMQVDENVGQVQQVKRIPDGVDEARLDKKARLETLDDGPGPGEPRPVTTKKPEVAVEPKRKGFGAGFLPPERCSSMRDLPFPSRRSSIAITWPAAWRDSSTRPKPLLQESQERLKLSERGRPRLVHRVDR